MEELKKILNNIIDSDFYELALDGTNNYFNIFEKRFVLSDLEISSRVLKHWKEHGLLPDVKEPNDNEYNKVVDVTERNKITRTRNKFNFFGLIYLYIIQDLRGFGFPLKKLKKVKEVLYSSYNLIDMISQVTEREIQILQDNGIDIANMNKYYKHKDELIDNADMIPEYFLNAPLLNYIIIAIIINKIDLKLTVTIEGDVSFDLTNSVGQVAKTKFNSQPHIILPLYNYLYRFLSVKKYKKYYTMYRLLNDKELYILEQVRSGMYKEIIIKKGTKGKISMELTEELKTDNAARLQDILLKGAYQELTVKTADGDIQYTTRKTKKKL